ncbi:hypothetical protein LIER_07698 [Lithospermum erythrorhizon]|uniref:Uncharacterized protein n=1 Tax=Lithospermum erythrorhizon TaxID=34254 RepID=A0AAV3P957_LITER
MTCIQFYFYDPLHQASNRMNTLSRLDMSIVERELTTNRRALKLLVCGWLESGYDSGDQSELWDIRVYTKSGRSHKVQYYYGCYDLLQYVLIFPNAEPCWHNNIPKVGCSVPNYAHRVLQQKCHRWQAQHRILKQTMLTEFFNKNATDPEARNRDYFTKSFLGTTYGRRNTEYGLKGSEVWPSVDCV